MTKTIQELFSTNVSIHDILGKEKTSKIKYKDDLKKVFKNPLFHMNSHQASIIKQKIMKDIGTTENIFILICTYSIRGIPNKNKLEKRVNYFEILFNNKKIKIEYSYEDIKIKKKNLNVYLHINDFKFNESPFKLVDITPYVAPVVLTKEEIIEVEKKKIE